MKYQKGLDDWIKGKVKVLFITGICGSGKTTYAKTIARANGAKLIELDEVRRNIKSKIAPISDIEQKSNIIVSEALLKSNEKVVVEGVEILYCQQIINSEKFPLIIIDENLTLVACRAIYRDIIGYNALKRHPEIRLLSEKIHYIFENVVMNYTKWNYGRWKAVKEILKSNAFKKLV
ncbi:MAG: hypothetical protein HQK53_16420 [Oligoflexia bacterium]|nr:hypothetical protein [Oligoflexia bacterium]